MKLLGEFIKRVWLRFMYPSRENVHWKKGLPHGLHEGAANALQWQSIAVSDVFRESMPVYIRWMLPKIWCAMFQLDNLSADIQLKLSSEPPKAQAFLLQRYRDANGTMRSRYVPIEIHFHQRIAMLTSRDVEVTVYVRKILLRESCGHQPTVGIEKIAPITDCFEPIRCSHGYVSIEYLTGPAYTPLY